MMETAFLVMAVIWLILQGLALWLLKGRWRIAAWVSGSVMLAALAVGILGGLSGSNLAPIWIVFALPLCAIWIVALWIAYGLVSLLRASR